MTDTEQERFELYEQGEEDFLIHDMERSDSFGLHVTCACESKDDAEMILAALNSQQQAGVWISREDAEIAKDLMQFEGFTEAESRLEQALQQPGTDND